MKIRAVLTDLDGTMLELDGSVHRDVSGLLRDAVLAGVPICPVTSKTPAELEAILGELGLSAFAGFENGAGVRHPDGHLELAPAALALPVLRRVLDAIRGSCHLHVSSIEEITDTELEEMTGLSGPALARARQRQATLPLVVDPGQDEMLRDALPSFPKARLIRGNRFLHLQGGHDKADVVPRMLELLGERGGGTVGLGDAPNDIGMLTRVDVAVIVPSRQGPNPVVTARIPRALVAPGPHGRGWAAALRSLAEAPEREVGMNRLKRDSSERATDGEPSGAGEVNGRG